MEDRIKAGNSTQNGAQKFPPPGHGTGSVGTSNPESVNKYKRRKTRSRKSASRSPRGHKAGKRLNWRPVLIETLGRAHLPYLWAAYRRGSFAYRLPPDIPQAQFIGRLAQAYAGRRHAWIASATTISRCSRPSVSKKLRATSSLFLALASGNQVTCG